MEMLLDWQKKSQFVEVDLPLSYAKMEGGVCTM